MTLNARESLSALMDNEGDELELRRVLKSLDSDEDAAMSWRRYHLMRSIMRRETDSDPSVDLSVGIMAQLEHEPAPVTQSGMDDIQERRGGISLARGAGIAATVSLMMIGGVQFYNGSLSDPSGAGTAAPGLASSSGSGSAGIDSGRVSGSGLATVSAGQPSLMDLPMFQAGQNSGDGKGLMTVGAQVASPMFLAPSASASSRQADQEQAYLLQSYLDRHAQGAAFSTADNWMPMLRETSVSSASN
ncbi:sigma-E factor negative regulatory protein [Halomonas huangheensis]|uniref:Anti sigma-E protein RseA N-terminal domain-containing protein n=1 Tax=Halomonas huangheensis TaxID=1178482 RepID=W1N2L9_9GAMM|nr:sigma-E factor negative regulatory protein [Halomonas huangheensis]ALM52198.1 anti-sigma factor [Halomonas huangheensis]ERL49416.1 hypothetical protein BJB45_06450 [Halomonas huangheensis]